MNTNKIIIGGLIGFVVAFLLGFLFYGVLLSDFFASNAGSATGVNRAEDQMQWIPMIIGHLGLGFLFAVILGRWANISTFSTGAMAGAVIGFLMGTGWDMIMYGSSNIMNMTGTLADIALTTVMSALIAGAIGWYYGYSKK
jgi:hypothetical protein